MPGLKVLIVDDNKRFCDNMVDILELKGYEILGVYDGAQAIEAVKKQKYDVVLLDVKLSGMSGLETLKTLKDIAPDINVIMITALADDLMNREEIINTRMKIMQKPMDIDKLCLMLETIS